MKAKELLVEFYDMANDQSLMHDYDDTRRPRLTLANLHKIRVSKDAERVDRNDYLEFLPSMYSRPSETM